MKRNLAHAYLLLMPLVAFTSAFVIGHIHYGVYVPVWLLHVSLATIAVKTLGGASFRGEDQSRRNLAIAAAFLIIPITITLLFFGIGPPPDTIAGWVATATEQQVRYLILVVVGIVIALGFALLWRYLATTKGSFYSTLGMIAIAIAIPLFIINMIYWGAYLTEIYEIMNASGLTKLPEWARPLRNLFAVLSLVEVALTFAGTWAFAAALHATGLIAKRAFLVYAIMCTLWIATIIFSFTEPFLTMSTIISIPAIPFIMPYIMGLRLLRKAGESA